MIRLSFTTAEVDALRAHRYAHPHPRVQRKMEALLLKSYGLHHKLIADIVGVCPNTLRSYFEDYLQGGTDRLFEICFYMPKSDLVLNIELLFLPTYSPNLNLIEPKNGY
ncbi:MAG: hypothetical protein HQM16_13230 [Deltaproteobacteria bacterium]|nr:hypothetical protein [Deltaproteobacteria bacterium]